jgi:glycosyltransferase involved in cell wall biosynthesis
MSSDPQPPAQHVVRRRVLFGWSSEGLSPVFTRRLAAYTRLGYAVTYAGFDRLRSSRDREEGGVKYRYVARGFGYANRTLLVGIPWWLVKLCIFALGVKADVFHAFDLDSGFPLAIAARWRKIPLVYDVLDNFELRHHWPWPLLPLIRAAEAFTCRTAGTIVVTDQNRIVGTLGKFAEKVIVINGCPPDRAGQLEPQPARDPESLRVAFVGFLAKQRGLGFLIAAAKALQHIEFVLIGRLMEPSLAEELGSLSNVRQLGAVDWESCIVELARTDVMCAFYDPMVPINRLAASLKWFDAMMLGIPILSNREIVNAAWIEREDIGYTVPYDAVAVAALIEEIRCNPDERRRKGANGRRLFENKYNWDIMQDRLCSGITRTTEAGEVGT